MVMPSVASVTHEPSVSIRKPVTRHFGKAARRDSLPTSLRRGNSFHQWMDDELRKDDAVRTLQLFVRTKLKLRAVSAQSNSLTASGSSSLASTALPLSLEEQDDAHQQFEVLLWHGFSLGVEFDSCSITGYPRITDDSGSNDSLPGMWNLRNGDFLISVNGCSTNTSSVAFEQIMQIVEDGVRPAVLRFRRPGALEMQKDLMSRSRRMSCAVRQDLHKRRERLERSLSYIIWREEDGPLGIVLRPDKAKPYPIVSEISEHGTVGQQASRSQVSIGDLLLSINHLDVSQMGYKKAIQMLQFAPRPLILTFRHAVQEPEAPRCLDL
ncbi:hypothetical protein FI667_g15682, partial [Globisporangium splendens]